MTNNTIYELTNIVKNAMANQLNVQLDGKPYESYEVKVITEHSYTVNARSKDEAALKAIRKYDEEGKSKEPVPAYGAVIVNGEEYGTEEEMSEFDSYYWVDENGMESAIYVYGCDLCADIVKIYRLTAEEKAELEKRVALLKRGEDVSFDLPFTTLYIYRGDEE